MGACTSKAVVAPERARREAARTAAQHLLAGGAQGAPVRMEGLKELHACTAKAGQDDTSSRAGTPLSSNSTAGGESSHWSVGGSPDNPPAGAAPLDSSQEVAATLHELSLGRIIGCWGGSLVYRGTFRQQQVAVMVTDHLAEDEEEAASLEARLRSIASSPELEHPHLARVLHCAVERPALADSGNDGAALACCGQGQAAECCEELLDECYLDMGGSWHEDASLGWSAAPCRRHLQVWTISELCGQGTLETAIARGWLRKGSSALGKAEAGPDLPAILTTAQEIAAALAHLHAHGFAHGNLTSAHVLLSHACSERPFTAKLTSACHLACTKAPPRSQQTLRLDCAVYTAPEVLLGASWQPSPGADVYALGVLLHEMYSGQLAWDTLHGNHVVRDMLAGRHVLPPLGGCPPSFQALVRACTAPCAADRPGLSDILASLRRLQETLS